MRITLDITPALCDRTGVGTYVRNTVQGVCRDIGPDCVFSGPFQIDVPATPADVQSFVDYVRAAADACGLAP